MMRKNPGKTVVCLSSKGQFTVPAAIRNKVGIKRGDFLKTYTIGDKLILLEKVPISPFEEIVERFSRMAANRSLSEEQLARLIKEARKVVTRQLYGG